MPAVVACGCQSRLVLVVSVPDDLIRFPAPDAVPVVVVQRSVDQRCEKDQRSDKEEDFHNAISRLEVSQEGQSFHGRLVVVRTWAFG